MELDEIIYAALTASEALEAIVGDRIISTCIERPPAELDSTQFPYIIITDDALQNELSTKDDEWESDTDQVQAGVMICGTSPSEVKQIRRLVRKSVAAYVQSMTEDVPTLVSLSNEGIKWDWDGPCYWDVLHYQCEVRIDLTEDEDEQEIDN